MSILSIETGREALYQKLKQAKILGVNNSYE